MPHRVGFSPRAREDLRCLYAYIADRSGSRRAKAYLDRIKRYCEGLAEFPQRGTRRNDIAPGLRVTGFERRVLVAFHIEPGLVTIDRILYGGRDAERLAGKL